MTLDEFFATHNIFHKVVKVENIIKNIVLVINKTSYDQRNFNFDYTDNDAMDFALYTGSNIKDIADDIIYNEIIKAYDLKP